MNEKTDEKPGIDHIFVAEAILPDAANLFEEDPVSLKTAIDDADVVLDTNVLLIPFGSAASSLSGIAEIYRKLKDRDRLHVPAQVAREFVKQRPSKLAELHKGIGDQISKLTVPDRISYPILDEAPEVRALNDLLDQVLDLKTKIKSAAKSVRLAIKNWGTNDPVSQAYRPIFTSNLIVEPTIEKEKVVAEMRRRYKQSLPPGYKDASKSDEGIGDFLIWKTILHLGQKNNRHMVFVSGDEKADWMHGSDKNGFLVRYELQAEYRNASGGKDFFIVPLSHLLELMEAEATSVDEVRTEEKRIREATSVMEECPECQNTGVYELGEALGSSALPRCRTCGSKFHLHRAASGTIVRRYRPQMDAEIIECPNCGAENLKELGVAPRSTAWCVCDDCEERFPIHRRFDGTVLISREDGS